MSKRYKIAIGIFAFVVVAFNVLFTWVDRSSYTASEHYLQTNADLANVFDIYQKPPADSLFIGWSKVSLVPEKPITTVPMAGYGARNPMEADGIHDSVFVRTYVIKNKYQKIALISADLLIIHPEITKQVYLELTRNGWDKDEIYFGATHTHSSIGGWAPGVVGGLFAGTYEDEQVLWIASQIASSIQIANNHASKGKLALGIMENPQLIRNRLVGNKGQKDTNARALYFLNDQGKAVDITYGAHATCLGINWREISGDYPSVLSEVLAQDTLYRQASYRAGAVASMGTGRNGSAEWELATWIGSELSEQVVLLDQIGPTYQESLSIGSYKVPLSLPNPQLKISNNLCLRPWLFRSLVGEYPVDIAVVQLGDVLMVGLPCDFSGELALPLYEYARSKNLYLIINSFNGGYLGYIPHDKWYDLNKYETRTMSWYGPHMGAYVSQVIEKIIDHQAQ